MTDTAVQDLDLNILRLGLIHTPGVEQALKEQAASANWGDDWKAIQEKWMEQMLDDKYAKRLGRPEEVADLVAFIASPRANYINGANLRIDGGKSPAIN